MMILNINTTKEDEEDLEEEPHIDQPGIEEEIEELEETEVLEEDLDLVEEEVKKEVKKEEDKKEQELNDDEDLLDKARLEKGVFEVSNFSELENALGRFGTKSIILTDDIKGNKEIEVNVTINNLEIKSQEGSKFTIKGTERKVQNNLDLYLENVIFENSSKSALNIGTNAYTTIHTRGQVEFRNNNNTDKGAAIVSNSRLVIKQDDDSKLIFSNNGKENQRWDKNGGAIYTKFGIEIDQSDNSEIIFEDNKMGSGGAIYSEADTIINQAKGSRISFINNTVVARGGAIYSVGSININQDESSELIFRENKAKFSGGAIYAEKGLNIKQSNSSILNFDSNIASEEGYNLGEGGAIYVQESLNINKDILDLTNNKVIFNDNKAAESGGAIFSKDLDGRRGEIVILASNESDIKFISNTAKDKGGAIYMDYISNENPSYKRAFLENVIFDGNKVSDNKASRGGAIYFDNTFNQVLNNAITVKNVEFKSNKAYFGGAIASNIGDNLIVNTQNIKEYNFLELIDSKFSQNGFEEALEKDVTVVEGLIDSLKERVKVSNGDKMSYIKDAYNNKNIIMFWGDEPQLEAKDIIVDVSNIEELKKEIKNWELSNNNVDINITQDITLGNKDKIHIINKNAEKNIGNKLKIKGKGNIVIDGKNLDGTFIIISNRKVNTENYKPLQLDITFENIEFKNFSSEVIQISDNQEIEGQEANLRLNNLIFKDNSINKDNGNYSSVIALASEPNIIIGEIVEFKNNKTKGNGSSIGPNKKLKIIIEKNSQLNFIDNESKFGGAISSPDI